MSKPEFEKNYLISMIEDLGKMDAQLEFTSRILDQHNGEYDRLTRARDNLLHLIGIQCKAMVRDGYLVREPKKECQP